MKALACELPAASQVPLARWSCPDLAREAAARGITPAISASTVRRWLAGDVLKPWQHRSWIFPATRASRQGHSCARLYQRVWDSQPLAGDEYVISADEKPGVQARRRIHPPSRPGRAGQCGPKASTPAAAPWLTWPPTTSTTPA